MRCEAIFGQPMKVELKTSNLVAELEILYQMRRRFVEKVFLGKMKMNRKIPLNILPLKKMTQKPQMEAVIVTRECKH